MRPGALRLVTYVTGASLLGACATGTILQEDSGAPPDAGSWDSSKDSMVLPLDGAADAFVDVGVDVFDAGCAIDASLGGIGVPADSTATATTTYSTNTPDLVIDKDTATYWNAGQTTGSLTIAFPSATSFDAVHIQAVASPASSETYTITGYKSGTPTVIGSSTQSVPQGDTALSPISVTAGAYDSIQIDVSSSQSWVAVAEVSLLTPYCP